MLCGSEKSEDHLHEDSAFSFQPFLRSKPPTLWTAKKGPSVVHETGSLSKDSQEELNLHANPAAATEHETEESLVIRPKACDSMFDNGHPSSPDEGPEQSEENQNREDCSAPVTAPGEDGYNWRKYGQKQVKNSEHPRSYYKCTHPSCPVKKKVERSVEGHVTEIVYRGSHTHPLPLPSRRSSVPPTQLECGSQSDGLENLSSKPGPGYHSAASQSQGIAPDGQFQDVHREALETKLSGSLTTTEIADRPVMDVSSTLSSNENGDRAVPPTNGRNEDETESKRRKMEASAATNTTTNTGIDMAAMASRASREPRIVVQTTSEVDILDDGYRWRKYGQKVVKGNPNPRSYYKCTYAGCSVRKHVERASNDLKSVITTYEGKHNHEVPAARNSGNGHPSSGSTPAPPQGSGGLHRRLEPPQVSIPRLSAAAAAAAAAAAYGSLSLRFPPQLSAAPGGFSFGMLRPTGMAPSLGGFLPAQMPGRGLPMQGCAGLVLPRGEAKVVSPEQQSGLPVANGNAAATYQQQQQQLMARWAQGHQM